MACLEYDSGMKKAGRPIDIESVLKVQDGLKAGFTASEIARAMKKPRQQVSRWVKYVEDGLVEVKENNVDKV
jgi:DNA invertase Pin-like site-specific DNA recombinase